MSPVHLVLHIAYDRIIIGIKGSCLVPQGSCNIDINFPDLFLDGAHVAAGMQINNVCDGSLYLIHSYFGISFGF